MRHFYLIVVLLSCSMLSSQAVARGEGSGLFSQQEVEKGKRKLKMKAQKLKIGFINTIRLMDEAPQIDSANRRLERKFAPRQRRLVSAQQRIRQKEKKLAKNAAVKSDFEVRKLSREIREKKRELKRQQEEFQEDINIQRSEELGKIQKVITQVIQELGKKYSYDFILSDGVIFRKKKFDITDEVLRQLHYKERRRR
jgi:outer membrane protein